MNPRERDLARLREIEDVLRKLSSIADKVHAPTHLPLPARFEWIIESVCDELESRQ